MAMLSFARRAGCEQRLEVSALAGAVTRLYDDLIDGSAAVSLDAQLSDSLRRINHRSSSQESRPPR